MRLGSHPWFAKIFSFGQCDGRHQGEAGTTIPWDPGMVVIDALRHLGTDATPQQLRAYLQTLKGWTGIQGTYDFTAYKQRGIGESAVAFFRWDAPKADFLFAFPTARR